MIDYSHSNIEFNTNLFKKLTLEIIKSTQRISYIADGGIKKGGVYQQAIKKFEEELEKGLNESSPFTWHEILYITNELATQKKFFDTLMGHEELETFIILIKKYEKLSIYKKIFNIYFSYYSTLHKANAMSVIKMYLKSILRNYKGKNSYINNLISLKEYFFGNLPDLLEHYKNDFEAIKKEMKLQDNFEFSKALLNLKIIQELKSLKYDEENQKIFSTIIERKEMFFADNLTLKEYVVKYLIDVAMKENLPFPNWEIFILQLLGDPRTTSMYTARMGSWNIIGEEREEFFIKKISQRDLKLFLDVLSDSVSDTNYHYRKAFWMQFLEQVKTVKIMVGKDAYENMNPDMQKNFALSNDSYSLFKGNHAQSAIYIDFGKIKVIEFTHNGSVRFYTDCPINLHQKEFSSSKIANGTSFLKTKIAHNGANTYSWQQYVLNIMNQELNTNISIDDIRIPEDKVRIEAYNKKGRYI